MRSRRRHAGTRYAAQAVGAYFMRGLMLRKRRHRLVDIRAHAGLSRHEYYTAREHLIETGCLHTRKTGMYRATRAELVRFSPVEFFVRFTNSDLRELTRILGLPVKTVLNKFPELARHALSAEWTSAFEAFQRVYPHRDRPIPYPVLLGEFSRACARYGAERVMEVARMYRAQQDQLARQTNGRSGTGTRWVMTVERFLSEIPQLERKLRAVNRPVHEMPRADIERAVGFLHATYGTPVAELRALLAQLPKRVIDDINDPMTRRTVPVVYPTYESFRNHCLGRARLELQPTQPVQHPPPEPADTRIAELVQTLIQRGLVNAEDAPRVEHACRTRPALLVRLNLLLKQHNEPEIRRVIARI